MATKPKPKGWNAMSKAKQDAWKKANFSSSTKVTTAQLNKLRAEKTPEKAIAKYKNDPTMREALNRFYGKSRVGGSSSSNQPSGPGSKMIPRPSGGPGAKLGGDGRVKGSSKSSTATRTYGSRTGGKITVNAAADDKRKADFKKRTNTALTVASMIPAVRGGMAAKAAYGLAAKQIGVGGIKAGVKKGIATKGELSQARNMARGMVKDAVKLKSKITKAKVTNTLKNKPKSPYGAKIDDLLQEGYKPKAPYKTAPKVAPKVTPKANTAPKVVKKATTKKGK